MPRPRTEIGQWGAISSKQQPDGRYRVWTRYRDTDGELRLVEAYGPSTAAGTRKLRQALANRGKDQAATIAAKTTMKELGELWLTEREHSGRKITPQSLALYRSEFEGTICAPKTGIAKVSIREATTSRLDAFLKPLAAGHPAKAKRVRAILTGMFALAVRHDAIEVNPMREVAPIRGVKQPVQVLGMDQLSALRERIARWQAGERMPEDERERPRGGQGRNKTVLDVVDVLLGTGCRVGEVLALRWQDVDLQASTVRVTIAGTLVTVGGKLVRQDNPKTDAGHRVVLLPRFAADTLLRMKFDVSSRPGDPVFPSQAGGWRSPHNFRRQWRDARGPEFEWVTPHTFRKTVATLIAREGSSVDAAAQLGHSGDAVTKRHYVERAAEAPDSSAILQKLRRIPPG